MLNWQVGIRYKTSKILSCLLNWLVGIKYKTVYVLFSAHNYEIQRERIALVEILGNGQFGDVHKGVYREKVNKFMPLGSLVSL